MKTKPDNRNICWLNEPPFHQCCCQCVSRVPDHFQCTKARHKKGLCFKPRGWICIGLLDIDIDGGYAMSDHPEHSVGCELYRDRRKMTGRLKPRCEKKSRKPA